MPTVAAMPRDVPEKMNGASLADLATPVPLGRHGVVTSLDGHVKTM
jgi:hypothetical protein